MSLQVGRDEIIQKLNLYGLAVDSRRWDLFDTIFTADSNLDYGEGARWNNLKIFKRDFEDMHSVYAHTQHAISNHVVVIDHDQARAFSYASWRIITKNEQAYSGSEGTAYYDDSLIRLRGDWFIQRRTIGVTWRNEVSLSAEQFDRLNSELPMKQVVGAPLAILQGAS